MHMSSQKPTEVLMDLLSMVPLLEIGAIQLMCRLKEVSPSGAGDIVAMELASDDPIFAPGGQLGGRVRELMQLEAFCNHCYLLVVQLRVPLLRLGIAPDSHIKVVY